MSQFLMPRVYTVEELGELSKASTDRFVSDRHRAEEELSSHYHDCFEKSYDDISRALYQTDNLFALKNKGQPLLIDGLLSILRNMDRPTVSEDDFKSLSDTGTAAASRFQDEQLSSAALEYLARNLNMDIFPWIEAGEQPTDKQKHAACVAVSALIADQKTKTMLRGQSSKAQKKTVRDTLVNECGMRIVDGHDFAMLPDAPNPGEVFKRETKVDGTKADVVFGLFDGRIMCLECKVSNSEVNSYKRLNHEAVDKVAKWREAFGRQCVSGAVLQGCFKTSNLLAAQEEGAFLFWSADLSELIKFVNSTKS